MQEFNGRRYDGVLDEDPARHVDAFWYGLKSSASIARLPCVWMSVLGIALSIRCSSPTMSPWGALATQMDDKQVAAFVAAVNELGTDE